MGKEKMLLAVHAAGYAMVNPDDCETIARHPQAETKPADAQESGWAPATAPAKTVPTQDWFSYFFGGRPALR